MEVELNKARQEAEELKIQLEENVQRAEDLKKSEINLKNLVASLAVSVAEPSNLDTVKIDDRSNDHKSQEKKNASKLLSAQEAGTIWENPKGDKKIVLSVSSRDLVDTKNGKLLGEVDPVLTKELAEKWLKIRPQGGRIFIDSDGHASTLIEGRLIYLGKTNGLLK
jgi:hypothetical protein